MNTASPEVVILDIMLPTIDGFEVCLQIRRQMPRAVIIMLTARGEDLDKVMGLDLGADDYMVKPFNPLELIARIRAHLRKLKLLPRQSSNLHFQQLNWICKGSVYKWEQPIELTPTEFAIMKLFMQHPQKAFTRNEILNAIWGKNYFGDLKTVDVHIRRIREKIEDNPSDPQWIETVWGVGYRLKGAKHDAQY